MSDETIKPSAVTDEALMAAYLSGDRRAFAELFARLAPRVHGFFLRSFRSRALADDLLQTTFFKLHRARETYRKDSALRPWLFAIAARVRVDELRRIYRLPETVGEEELARHAEANPNIDGASLEESDLRDRVRAAIDALPEAQRAVVHLHRFEQLTFGEIARVLGSTEGAIKVRAFRAYERLREALHDLAVVSKVG